MGIVATLRVPWDLGRIFRHLCQHHPPLTTTHIAVGTMPANATTSNS